MDAIMKKIAKVLRKIKILLLFVDLNKCESYNYQLEVESDINYCRCPNQQYVTEEDYCEICMMRIKRDNIIKR